VHSAALFGGWHPLPAMAASFSPKELEFCGSLDFQAESALARVDVADFRADATGELVIDSGLLVNEQFGILATFGSADFDDELHVNLL
jgi:hypothetical protein